MKQIRYFLLLAGIATTSLFFAGAYVMAQQADSTQQPSITTENKDTQELTEVTQGVTPTPYTNAHKLRSGTVVQPDDKDAKHVIAATQDKLEKAFGIIVSNDGMPISITNAASAEPVVCRNNWASRCIGDKRERHNQKW